MSFFLAPRFFQDLAVFILQYRWGTWTLTHGEKAGGNTYKNSSCSLEQTLQDTHYKTIAVQLIAFYLTIHSSKMNMSGDALQEKKERTHNHRSFIDSIIWRWWSGPTRKDWLTSALCGHRISCKRPVSSNGWYGPMARKRVKKIRITSVTWW